MFWILIYPTQIPLHIYRAPAVAASNSHFARVLKKYPCYDVLIIFPSQFLDISIDE